MGTELGPHDVGQAVAQQLSARLDQQAHAEDVGERSGGAPQPGLVAEQPRDPLLERVDGGVLAVDVVADLGGGHRLAHRGAGTGQGVGAEVDHRWSSDVRGG